MLLSEIIKQLQKIQAQYVEDLEVNVLFDTDLLCIESITASLVEGSDESIVMLIVEE